LSNSLQWPPTMQRPWIPCISNINLATRLHLKSTFYERPISHPIIYQKG
jgi:hypothetical protein